VRAISDAIAASYLAARFPGFGSERSNLQDPNCSRVVIACAAWWCPMGSASNFSPAGARLRTRRIFHLGFIPSNFYYRRDQQLATLVQALERAATEARRERLVKFVRLLTSNREMARRSISHGHEF
jgi:hypothetical protein